MTAYMADKRPNCNQILDQNDLWDTSFIDFMKKKEIRISNKIKTIEDSFYLFFLRTKLGQNSSPLKTSEYEQNFKEIEVISTGSFGTIVKAVDNESNENFSIYKIPLSEDQRKEVSVVELKTVTTNKSEFLIEFHKLWIEENYGRRNYKIDQEFNSRPGHQDFYPNKLLILHIQMEPCFRTLKQVIQILDNELNRKPSEMMNICGYFVSSQLFIELLESVDYLHKQNIILKNLEPENILVTNGLNSRFIKLTHFGSEVTRIISQSRTRDSSTDKYVIPEVAGGRVHDSKSDIYILGIIAQELFKIDINE